MQAEAACSDAGLYEVWCSMCCGVHFQRPKAPFCQRTRSGSRPWSAWPLMFVLGAVLMVMKLGMALDVTVAYARILSLLGRFRSPIAKMWNLELVRGKWSNPV